jgi:FtsH-binding integral membrane protein
MNSDATILPASEATVSDRATFLQKTYRLLLFGVLGFALTLWAAGSVDWVRNLALGLWRTHPLIVMIGLFAASWFVHSVAEKHPINLIAYWGYVFLFGLLLAPIVLWAASTQGPSVLATAAVVTAIVFTGLTAYVIMFAKDFSFLGGALSIGIFAMIGIAVAGMIFGFQVGLWYSVLGVVLFSGYILYDTSMVLHHYRPTQHVSAAIVLFTDVVLLFKHLLLLLSRRD